MAHAEINGLQSVTLNERLLAQTLIIQKANKLFPPWAVASE